jgi:hypothetical protein
MPDLKSADRPRSNSNSKFSLIVAETIELNASSEVHIKVYETSVVPVPPNILGTETLMAHLTNSPGMDLPGEVKQGTQRQTRVLEQG